MLSSWIGVAQAFYPRFTKPLLRWPALLDLGSCLDALFIFSVMMVFAVRTAVWTSVRTVLVFFPTCCGSLPVLLPLSPWHWEKVPVKSITAPVSGQPGSRAQRLQKRKVSWGNLGSWDLLISALLWQRIRPSLEKGDYFKGYCNDYFFFFSRIHLSMNINLLACGYTLPHFQYFCPVGARHLQSLSRRLMLVLQAKYNTRSMGVTSSCYCSSQQHVSSLMQEDSIPKCLYITLISWIQ